MFRLRFLLLLSLLLLLTGCTADAAQVKQIEIMRMRSDPKFMAPTQKIPQITRVVEMVTPTPPVPTIPTATSGAWCTFTTGDGMVTLDLPSDWKVRGGETTWDTPDGKTEFGILRFGTEPGTAMDASLLPGIVEIKDTHDFQAKDRSVRRILLQRTNPGGRPTQEAHYLIRRMDGKEVFDFYFSISPEDDFGRLAPTIQHMLDSMIWAMID